MRRCSCLSNMPELGCQDLASWTQLSWQHCPIKPCIQVSKTCRATRHRVFPAGHIYVAHVRLRGDGPSPGWGAGKGEDLSCKDSGYAEFGLGK